MTESEVIDRLADETVKAGGIRCLARNWGISVAYVSDCLNGRRAPGPSILGPLGIEKTVTVTYQPTGQGMTE